MDKNEKSRPEGIVFSIFSEIQHTHQHRFALYSGTIVVEDKALDLNGECDLVLSRSPQSIELTNPIFCIVEAKDNDIELGIPHCITQLCGAALYNKKMEQDAEQKLWSSNNRNRMVFLGMAKPRSQYR